MRNLFIILLLFLPPPQVWASEPWDDTEKGMFAVYLVTQYIDHQQTQKIVDEPFRYELNPILGKYPTSSEVTTYFVLATTANYLIANALKPKYRKPFIALSVILGTLTISHNFNVGIRF